MANANTNLMSINLNTSASSTGSTSKNFGLHSSQKGGNDFAQGKPSDAEEIQYTEATEQNPAAPVEQPKNSKSQGENQQPQDAPQNLPQQNSTVEKNISAEIQFTPAENISPNIEISNAENILPEIEINPAENISSEIIDAPEIPAVAQFIFNVNTENLLPVQNSQKVGEVNLMTVVPQEGGDKAQAMLNFLSGKTWTAEDVKASIAPQNQQNVQVNPETLQFQSGKNFTLNTNQNQNAENIQPQILIQSTPIQTQQQNLNPQQNLNLQQQPQNLNLQQTNLNSEQAPQIQTQQQQPLMQTQPQVELQNQPIVNSLQPQVELKPVHQQQQISDLIGQNLQIEDNQNAAPLSPVQPMLRQQPEQNQQNQQQPANQNFQQNFSQDLNSEMQVQQNVGGEESFAQNLTPATNNVSTTQPAAQVQNPETAAQAARQNENIPAQIVEQARLIRNAENTEMVINLKPEHLGQLTLRVSVSQNGAVNASFYSDNAQVRAAIENSLVQLRQELNDQGLKVDNVQVYAGLSDGGLTNGQGGQAWQQQQQNNAPRRIDFDSLQEEVDAVTPANEVSAEGVDYKI